MSFKAYADVVARLRVFCGFLLVITFAWLSDPSPLSLAWGLPVSLMGLLLRAWATGHLEKNIRLAQSGPYAYVRNPLYLGTALVAAGLVVASRRWALAAIFVAVFVLVYLPAITLEEQHLRKLFPVFEEYSARVPKLLPAFRDSADRRRFRSDLYWHNREYQAALGFLAGTAFLIGKMLFIRG